MFQIRIDPSFEAVMIWSEFGEKHKQVTALCMSKVNGKVRSSIWSQHITKQQMTMKKKFGGWKHTVDRSTNSTVEEAILLMLLK